MAALPAQARWAAREANVKFLGISGLQDSAPFKKEHWSGLDPREYRIAQGYDSAAALIVDGKLVAAAAEERFSRKKHTGDFPIGAIQYCLAEAGIAIEDVDEIAHGFDYAALRPLYAMDPASSALYEQVFAKEALVRNLHRELPQVDAAKIHAVPHHLAHAASAAFTSGWDECLVVVNDAMGEVQSLSVFQARGNELKKLREISANDSIGILYSLVTLHLGFDFNSDEYKIMGLAPYGDPAHYRAFFDHVVELCPDGTLRIPILRLNKTREERENYLATRAYLEQNLIAARARRCRGHAGPLRRGGRTAGVPGPRGAARLRTFRRTDGMRHIALAGGVALNCTANGKLIGSGHLRRNLRATGGRRRWHRRSARRSTGPRAMARCSNLRMPVPFLGPAHPQ